MALKISGQQHWVGAEFTMSTGDEDRGVDKVEAHGNSR
jgi:hypothetical protein